MNRSCAALVVSMAVLLSAAAVIGQVTPIRSSRDIPRLGPNRTDKLGIRAKNPRRPVIPQGFDLNGSFPWQFAEKTQITLIGVHPGGTDGSNELRFTTEDRVLKDANIVLRYDNKTVGARWLAWQVASQPFAFRTTNWQLPVGLIDSHVLTDDLTKTSKGQFQINIAFLARILHTPKLRPASGEPLLPTISNNRAMPKVNRGLMARPPTRIATQIPDLGQFFIRVVPLDPNGKAVGNPSNSVSIRIVPPAPPVTIYDTKLQSSGYNAAADKVIRPSVRVAKYTPVHPTESDAMYWVEATRDYPSLDSPFGFERSLARMIGGPIWLKGHVYDLRPKENDSWWDDLCDAVGGVFDFLEGALNWVADAYDWLKEQAINVAVGIMGEEFRGPFTFALDCALTYVGLPPSLPHFDDLDELGKDYVASVISEQVPGLPKSSIREGIDTLVEETTKQRSNGGDPSNLFRPAPSKQYYPARVELVASNVGKLRTDPVTLYIYTVANYDWHGQRFSIPIYNPQGVAVPALEPGTTMRIPVYLCEYIAGWQGYYAVDPNTDMAMRWLIGFRNPGYMSLSVVSRYREVPDAPIDPLATQKKTMERPEFLRTGLTANQSYAWPAVVKIGAK